jgi:NAD(P)-dependent dehydrogenase (short-subunit alcohol dehydrogenase family)
MSRIAPRLRRPSPTPRRTLGPIAILVNNAGVPSGAFFTKTTEEEWRAVMSVNLDGVFRVGQEAARRMAANRTGGSIINIASLLGFGVIKGLSTYSATKAAVISLTKSMALELARDNIRVNALAPGYFATEFNEAYLASDAGKRMLARVPMGRAGRGGRARRAAAAARLRRRAVHDGKRDHRRWRPPAGDGVAVIRALCRLVPGIQPSVGAGASGTLDPGDKHRDDNRGNGL